MSDPFTEHFRALPSLTLPPPHGRTVVHAPDTAAPAAGMHPMGDVDGRLPRALVETLDEVADVDALRPLPLSAKRLLIHAMDRLASSSSTCNSNAAQPSLRVQAVLLEGEGGCGREVRSLAPFPTPTSSFLLPSEGPFAMRALWTMAYAHHTTPHHTTPHHTTPHLTPPLAPLVGMTLRRTPSSGCAADPSPAACEW